MVVVCAWWVANRRRQEDFRADEKTQIQTEENAKNEYTSAHEEASPETHKHTNTRTRNKYTQKRNTQISERAKTSAHEQTAA